MDRREVLEDRRTGERRNHPASRGGRVERRSGHDPRGFDRRNGHGDRRRLDDRRHRLAAVPAGGRRRTDWIAALPPRSRLVPALLVVAVTLADLAVAQATSTKAWPLLFIAAAFPIVAYDLANPWRLRWHLGLVWIAVSVFVLAAGVHIGYMLGR